MSILVGQTQLGRYRSLEELDLDLPKMGSASAT